MCFTKKALLVPYNSATHISSLSGLTPQLTSAPSRPGVSYSSDRFPAAPRGQAQGWARSWGCSVYHPPQPPQHTQTSSGVDARLTARCWPLISAQWQPKVISVFIAPNKKKLQLKPPGVNIAQTVTGLIRSCIDWFLLKDKKIEMLQ